jgi:hypothetical protein
MARHDGEIVVQEGTRLAEGDLILIVEETA